MLAWPKDAPADETHEPGGELHMVGPKGREEHQTDDQGELPAELSRPSLTGTDPVDDPAELARAPDPPEQPISHQFERGMIMGTLTVTGDTRRLLEQAVSKMDELHHRMAAAEAREARERRDVQHRADAATHLRSRDHLLEVQATARQYQARAAVLSNRGICARRRSWLAKVSSIIAVVSPVWRRSNSRRALMTAKRLRRVQCRIREQVPAGGLSACRARSMTATGVP